MKSRWLPIASILLTVFAVLASSPPRGQEADSAPWAVPVVKVAIEGAGESDVDDLVERGLLACLPPADVVPGPTWRMSCEDPLSTKAFHRRCEGTRGPPAVSL